MKRTILVHVEVADEIDYAAAIKRIANSPEIIDYMFTGNTKSLRALLSLDPPSALCDLHRAYF
jgi:hypothetical protein